MLETNYESRWWGLINDQMMASGLSDWLHQNEPFHSSTSSVAINVGNEMPPHDVGDLPFQRPERPRSCGLATASLLAPSISPLWPALACLPA